MSLKSVKAKIRSVEKTRQVTKAMEAVAAVKMRKSQASALSMRGYARAALRILASLSGTTDVALHPLSAKRTEGRDLLIVITSDRGLAGSYNSAILREANRFLVREGWKTETTGIMAIGRRGAEHFGKRGWTIVREEERWGEVIPFSLVEPFAGEAQERFLSGEYRRVVVVFTNFLSTLRQEVVVRDLLPLDMNAVRAIVRGIVPEKGRFSDLKEDDTATPREYSFEPSPERLLDAVLPMLIAVTLYHANLEANASEHSARMIAMKNASDNAGDMVRRLRLSFNKARQAAITREVSEIVGGMESMKAR